MCLVPRYSRKRQDARQTAAWTLTSAAEYKTDCSLHPHIKNLTARAFEAERCDTALWFRSASVQSCAHQEALDRNGRHLRSSALRQAAAPCPDTPPHQRPGRGEAHGEGLHGSAACFGVQCHRTACSAALPGAVAASGLQGRAAL